VHCTFARRREGDGKGRKYITGLALNGLQLTSMVERHEKYINSLPPCPVVGSKLIGFRVRAEARTKIGRGTLYRTAIKFQSTKKI
jgi:hypothetical protein